MKRWARGVRLVLVGLACACEASAPPADPPAPASLFEPESEPAAVETEIPIETGLRFEDVTESWGANVPHHAGRNPEKWIPEIMNGGVALIDVDRNGALDILMIDGGALAGGGQANFSPQLLLGDGKGGFSDATDAWGLSAFDGGYAMGVAAGDIDGDGWIDLYLTSYDGADRLLLNRGATGGGFIDGTKDWEVAPQGWSTSAAFFDMDGDGDLDLYVGRYIDFELSNSIKCRFRDIHVYCTPSMYEALPDRLYRNDGGKFTDVSELAGIRAQSTKTLALATGDLDDDGDIDLYVAGDTAQNLLWLNDSKGGFSETSIASGVALSRLGREEASMGVAVGDSDADGRWDLAVTNFQAEPTSLYSRREHAVYRERSDAAGIGASARARLGFGIEWIDADNDGDEDLLTANGHIADNVSTYRESVHFEQLNSLYERVDAGRFVDVSSRAGTALAHRGVSRGLAVGDLDGDGGVDYVIVNNDDGLQVARNLSEKRGHFINLWLESAAPSRSPIGAQVEARVGELILRREVRGASSYLSVSDRRVHLGLGKHQAVDSIEIRWPNGQLQSVGELEADQHLYVRQGQAPLRYAPGEKVLLP